MDSVLAITVGILVAGGVYMIQRRSIGKLLIGLALLGHAANLLIFTAAGLVRGRAPFVPRGQTVAGSGMADPLPQALILTAIVISFGVLAFAVVLIQSAVGAAKTDDIEQMRVTEQ